MTRDRSDRYADADEQYQQDPRWAGPGEYAPENGYGPASNYETSDDYGPSDGYQSADRYEPYDGYSASAVRDAYARDAYARAGGYAAPEGRAAPGGYAPGDPYAPAEEGYGYQEPGDQYDQHDPYQNDHGYAGDGYDGDDQYASGYGQDDAAGYQGHGGYQEQNPFRWQPGEDARRPEEPGEDPDEPSGYTGRAVRQMQPPPRDEDRAPGWDNEPPREGFIPGLGGGSRRGRSRRRMGRVLAPLLALALLAAVSVSGYVAYKKIHLHSADYPGPGTGHVTVQVLPGDTATSLAPRLVKDGVVASVNSFVAAAKNSTIKATLQPGFFSLHKHMKASLAYKLLLSPSARMQTVVTVPEGLRMTQILALLQKKLGTSMPANAFANAIKDTAALGLPPYANGNPEGYLFPATYDIPPGTSAIAVLKMMVARYNTEAQTINLPAAAQRVQLVPAHVIIVASILEAEAGPQYYAQIAEVVYNRLNQGIPLGLDSTINYALNKTGPQFTQSQLQVNSPYNTRIHTGLPPGPIDSPGDAAIQAALHPDHGDLLYFVTVNLKTGLTLFTNSQATFNQDVAMCKANNAC